MKFGKVSLLIDPHYLRYTGQITNKGRWSKDFVTVKMSFFYEIGRFDHHVQALTYPLHLTPGETASSFTLFDEKMDPLPTYELDVTWDLDEESKNSLEDFSGL